MAGHGNERRWQPAQAAAIGIALVLCAGGVLGLPAAARAQASSGVPGAPPSAPGGPTAAALPLQTLSRVWQRPGSSLAERVAPLRREMRRRGIWDLDPAARYLLWYADRGSRLEQARAAVELAPTLPAAQAALARARLLERGDLPGALGSAGRFLTAFGDHLEASLWLAATLSVLAYAVALGVGIAFILLVGIPLFSHASHDLGDACEPSMPGFARAALLGALLLLPVALGEGALGGGLALFAVGFCYTRGARRLALAAAAAVLLLAVHPGAEAVARALGSLGSDPVAEAAYATERGHASPLDARRLARAGAEDLLAFRARALRDKRNGELEQADARYRTVVATGEGSSALLNNAANVRLTLGHPEEAIDLYERAIEGDPADALLWFNLAQAYARALRVEQHDSVLAHAQELDEDRIRELTGALVETEGLYVADLPLAARDTWGRILTPPRPPSAAAIRAMMAPGVLGSSSALAAAAWLVTALLATLAGRRFRPSRSCRSCGERICPRCTASLPAGTLCSACARVLHRPETADPSLRSERLERLRRRLRRQQRLELGLSLLAPGAAGLFRDRPLAALGALAAFATAVASLFGASRVVPDPLVAGEGAWLLFGGLAGLAGLVYAGLTGWVLLRGRS